MHKVQTSLFYPATQAKTPEILIMFRMVNHYDEFMGKQL